MSRRGWAGEGGHLCTGGYFRLEFPRGGSLSWTFLGKTTRAEELGVRECTRVRRASPPRVWAAFSTSLWVSASRAGGAEAARGPPPVPSRTP